MIFSKFIYYYFNLKGKANRVEYGIFLLIELVVNVSAYLLFLNTNFYDKTVVNFFYCWIIFNITYIPILAVNTRRLRYLKLHGGLIVLCFIPLISWVFRLYLLLKDND